MNGNIPKLSPLWVVLILFYIVHNLIVRNKQKKFVLTGS